MTVICVQCAVSFGAQRDEDRDERLRLRQNAKESGKCISQLGCSAPFATLSPSLSPSHSRRSLSLWKRYRTEMGVMSVLRGVVTVSLAGVVLAGGLLYAFQTRLIYPSNLPSGSRTTVSTPDEHGMPQYDEITLTTSDNVKIRAFVVLYRGERTEIRPTVLLLHANAGNVGHRLPIARVFALHMHCNVVALSYRGYGRSEGTYVRADFWLQLSPLHHWNGADSSLRAARMSEDYDLTLRPRWTTFCRTRNSRSRKSSSTANRLEELLRLILPPTTHSGSVVCSCFFRLRLTLLFPQIAGLIVENTFLSLPKLVPHVMPYLAPFMFLLHQRWPSEEKVQTFPSTLPVLFLSGSDDELIPPYHVAELCRLSGGKNQLVKFPNGTHSSSIFRSAFPAVDSSTRS